MRAWTIRVLLLLVVVASPVTASAVVTALPGATPQATRVGKPFPNPIAVRVTDESGAPVADATIEYYDADHRAIAIEPNAPCDQHANFPYGCRARTGSDGVAVLPALKGRWAGATQPRVIASKGPNFQPFGEIRLELLVEVAQPPATLELLQGADQRAVIGTALSPLSVRLKGNAGQPLAGERIYLFPFTFNTSDRGGFEGGLGTASYVVTDGSGFAALPTLRAAWGVGPQTVTARFLDTGAGTDVVLPIGYTATNNAGQVSLSLQDLWWGGPAENGWGVSVVQHRDQLFNVYFVYDDQGRPTWFVQPGGTWFQGVGSEFQGTLFTTRGSPWFAYDASRFTLQAQQNLNNIMFGGPQSSRIDVTVDLGTGRAYTWKRLVRQDFSRAGVTSPLQGLGDMWWGGPQQNGWGVAIHEQPGGLFIVWFTYDETGLPTWFVMPDGQWTDSATYAGAIYRTRSSAWSGNAYSSQDFRANAAGTFRLTFDGTQRARLNYELDGRGGSLALERQPF